MRGGVDTRINPGSCGGSMELSNNISRGADLVPERTRKINNCQL